MCSLIDPLTRLSGVIDRGVTAFGSSRTGQLNMDVLFGANGIQ